MIYGCLRAWRECPNLLLWNVGAWSILVMLAGDFAEHQLLTPSWTPVPPAPPAFAVLLRNAVHSEPFRLAQLGFAICGFLVMSFSLVRSVYRRLVTASPDSNP